MPFRPRLARDLLIPFGISTLSLLGISLIIWFINLDQNKAYTPAPPTETPFKYLFLATETHASSFASETAEETAQPAITEPPTVPSNAPTTTAPTPTLIVITAPPVPTNTAFGAPTNDPSIFYPGTYDDLDERIAYDGNWLDETVTGAFNETLSTSLTAGSSASFVFVGKQLKIGYLEGSELGIAVIMIDDAEFNLDQSVNTAWTSPELTNTEHFALITHESGDFIILDYITILASP